MGYSSDFALGGVASGNAVDAFTTSYPDFCVPATPNPAGSYIVVPISVDREKTYRGADIEFYGNAASTAFAANEVWIGFALPGETNLRLREYGTIGITTGSTALTNLRSAVGLPPTSSWYPGTTISTAWAPTGYASNAVETTSLIPSSATAPSSSDMNAAVLTIPYLDGATHLVFRCPGTSSTLSLAVAVRKISRDK